MSQTDRMTLLRVQRISRSKFPSIYQVVADHCGQPLVIEKTTYTPKQKFKAAHDALIFPAGVSCPALATRGRLWPAVEAAESRSDANLATHWKAPIPNELVGPAATALAIEFGQYLADYLASIVHLVVLPATSAQPAVMQALCTTREAGPDGFGLKNRFNLSVAQRRKRGFPISPRSELTDLRAAWAKISADHLGQRNTSLTAVSWGQGSGTYQSRQNGHQL